jgi:hypothetical protein
MYTPGKSKVYTHVLKHTPDHEKHCKPPQTQALNFNNVKIKYAIIK